MNILDGLVQSPGETTLGFDINAVLTPSAAAEFFDEGYRFCLRYLSRGAERDTDLSYGEACDILSAGLALMPVQHVAQSPWLPTAELGQEYGSEAAVNAGNVGFPAGVNVWCDLEGCPDASQENVVAYCKAWWSAVSGAGYVPGLYVGAQAGLSGLSLYEELPFQHYWKSESSVPVVATRGYQMIQKSGGPLIDKNSTQADNEGGQVLWLAPNP